MTIPTTHTRTKKAAATDDTTVIGCRAMPRPGFRQFFRGGHRWPVEGRTVRVTRALYDRLRAETYLSVDPAPTGEPEDGVLDVVENHSALYDAEHNAGAPARADIEALRAKKARLEAQVERERLLREIAELEGRAK